MKIQLSGVMVDDQDKALKFYTEVLGFKKKNDIPLGGPRWLTVVSADGPDDVELLLEPMGFEPAKVYQKALYEAGIPLTAFNVDDVDSQFERLKKLGVSFRTEPTDAGGARIAIFDDTCGNWIQIYQVI